MMNNEETEKTNPPWTRRNALRLGGAAALATTIVGFGIAQRNSGEETSSKPWEVSNDALETPEPQELITPTREEADSFRNAIKELIKPGADPDFWERINSLANGSEVDNFADYFTIEHLTTDGINMNVAYLYYFPDKSQKKLSKIRIDILEPDGKSQSRTDVGIYFGGIKDLQLDENTNTFFSSIFNEPSGLRTKEWDHRRVFKGDLVTSNWRNFKDPVNNRDYFEALDPQFDSIYFSSTFPPNDGTPRFFIPQPRDQKN